MLQKAKRSTSQVSLRGWRGEMYANLWDDLHGWFSSPPIRPRPRPELAKEGLNTITSSPSSASESAAGSVVMRVRQGVMVKQKEWMEQVVCAYRESAGMGGDGLTIGKVGNKWQRMGSFGGFGRRHVILSSFRHEYDTFRMVDVITPGDGANSTTNSFEETDESYGTPWWS